MHSFAKDKIDLFIAIGNDYYINSVMEGLNFFKIVPNYAAFFGQPIEASLLSYTFYDHWQSCYPFSTGNSTADLSEYLQPIHYPNAELIKTTGFGNLGVLIGESIFHSVSYATKRLNIELDKLSTTPNYIEIIRKCNSINLNSSNHI